MIVPMKKVTLIVADSEREAALKRLRRLGLMHIEQKAVSSGRLSELREKTELIEKALMMLPEKGDERGESRNADVSEALSASERIVSLTEERAGCRGRISALQEELDRLRDWGEIDLARLAELEHGGIRLAFYEMPLSEYKCLGEEIRTVPLGKTKRSVKFMTANEGEDAPAEIYRIKLPTQSTAEIRSEISRAEARIGEIDGELASCTAYRAGMINAGAALQKETELETHAVGMSRETLSCDGAVALAYFSGFIPSDDADKLRAAAKDSAWGLLVEDPTEEDNVPTKLKNNRLVSLIYPLTDFLGTVPGYFEYDISAWFLGFILIFFGIIFGDGGYGLLICAVAGALILKSRVSKKSVPAAYLLILLMGCATVLWGLLTCTWFGLSPNSLPAWLRSLSVPVISNVYADKLWYPFWTAGEAGLTTAQNVQIFCFALALVQLTVAHIKGLIRNRRSLKLFGDLGSVLQLLGIFYVVLSLVVNGEVFGLGRVIGGIPMGTLSIGAIGVGFVMTFVFANYEGNIGKSLLESLKNIVSVLLGVVNVFSDIVSYIRLWAVGLAGAAISATVNEMAGPLLGNFVFIILAIMLLVFGHGLNMILNVLSVIVHGVRLNTLEFSSHLGMSWGGHKYKPFEE